MKSFMMLEAARVVAAWLSSKRGSLANGVETPSNEDGVDEEAEDEATFTLALSMSWA